MQTAVAVGGATVERGSRCEVMRDGRAPAALSAPRTSDPHSDGCDSPAEVWSAAGSGSRWPPGDFVRNRECPGTSARNLQ